TTYTGTDRSVYVDPESDFIKALHSAYVEVSGDTVNGPVKSGGGTYAKAFSNCVAFGTGFPDEEEVAHLADEYATVENIQRCTEIYVRALLKLLEF
ncbi:MAG: M20/M25/M40 family metallo-hydrolase, partial [Oscillospiraceae bacterium]|nr:M20/M25/M40 family metallo-hydrolase [Oscillospiraceae bacterium]